MPMREIALSGGEPPLRVYDTSGPQGCDVREGLPPLRRRGSRARDVEATGSPADGHARGRADSAHAPARAVPGPRGRHAAALRAPGRDHARDGVRRAARGAARRVRARRGGARPRDHPGQHQPPRARADDHRPQLPGEDQRQHRQLRRRLVDRGGSREAALGDALGRRHGDGPVDRQEHPRDPRVDRPQLRRADRHGADLPGAREGRRRGRRISPGRSTATRSSSSASRAWTTSPCTPACCCATSR